MKKRILEDEIVTPESIEPKVEVPEVVTPESIEPKVEVPEVVKPESIEPKVEVPEVVKPEPVPVKEPVGVKFPEGNKTGRYNVVKVIGSEYSVYNPDGARVSGLMSLDEAKDIVRAQNQAAHIKIKG